MASRTRKATDQLLARRLVALRDRLGYSDRENYFDRASHPKLRHLPFVIRQALTSMSVEGVYALDDGFQPSALRPIVYLAKAADEVELANLRRDVWSQGVAPFLIAVLPDEIHVCGGFQPPDADPIKAKFDPDAVQLPSALSYYSANRIASSLTWRDLDIRRENSVDNQLVEAIEALNVRARTTFPELENEKGLINALIGKFLYSYVLADRGILTEDWLQSRMGGPRIAGDRSFVHSIFDKDTSSDNHNMWGASSALAVFDVVDQAINGSIFRIDERQRKYVSDDLCRLIHRVIRCGDSLYEGGTQTSLFNVSFAVLRTETISAIYERFIKIEDADKKRDDGVFYTPPHLVDHVLDRAEAVQPITAVSRIVDPAAGSGLFLVGAFRRLMERHAPPSGWKPRNIDQAKALLLSCIHGIELHAQAANVCRFSLYLTLLDYVGRASIDELVTAAGGGKFLPDLSENIVSESAFASRFLGKDFTHVVGNPPWAASTGQKDRANRGRAPSAESASVADFAKTIQDAGYQIGQNRLSDLFFWLAVLKLGGDEATVALVLPTRSLVGRLASAFAHSVGRHTTPRWIGNLFHLRRKLFPGVEAAACVLVVTNRPPLKTDRVAVYRPLLTSLPRGRTNEVWSLLASDSDIQYQRVEAFTVGKSGWFTQTVLSDLDRRMHHALSVWAEFNESTIGDFLGRSDLSISKGGSAQETGVVRPTKSEHDDKRIQVAPLSWERVAEVTPKFRGYFAGNVLLVARSMAGAEYYPHPVSFPSTFNAIVAGAQERAFRSGSSPALLVEWPTGFAKAFSVFITSQVMHYFSSVFGATYLIDKTRVEKNDLLAMPCPFLDWKDKDFLALAESDDPDADILSAMNAGGDFRAAFREFVDFRRYFANAQCPEGGLQEVGLAVQQLYIERLEAEIRAEFGEKMSMAVDVQRSAEMATLRVQLGDTKLQVGRPSVGNGLIGNATVVRSASGHGAYIFKSTARSAWTIDQAVSDASTVRLALRSGTH